MEPLSNSPYLALPSPAAAQLRLLGPAPEQAALAVEPLTRFDRPHGPLQAHLGALCNATGDVDGLQEIWLAVDCSTLAPSLVVPPERIVQRSRDASTPRSTVHGATLPPLLYCRKRHVVFAARSPVTGAALRALPVAEAAPADGALPLELLAWDGPANDGRVPQIYGGRGGSCAIGPVAAAEQLVLDQGEVVKRAEWLRERDAAAYQALAAAHTCCTCGERTRCYPTDGGYRYAVDRLVLINALETPLRSEPFGEFQWADAAAFAGGARPSELLHRAPRLAPAVDEWLARRAAEIERSGPPRLLAEELDGRALLETLRIRVSLVAGVLAQLAAVWRDSAAPHLCWNEDTVRVAWARPGALPATAWGLVPRLRKAGVQPLSDIADHAGRPLPYPPELSDPALLPPQAAETIRFFGESHQANVFVKRAKAESGAVAATVLVEDVRIAWDLFRTGDVVLLSGQGWEAVLAPHAVRDPADGEGIPLSGRVTGPALGAWKAEAQLTDCRFRWFPRFGEATDLYALGLLALEALLRDDELHGAALRGILESQLRELRNLLVTARPEQREEVARGWIATNAAVDTPGSPWSRRRLAYAKASRASSRLEGLPVGLWQAVLTCVLRMVTMIEGFGYCADRACDVPRLAGGTPLPLAELRGILAMIDDVLFHRAAAVERLRETLRKTPPK